MQDYITMHVDYKEKTLIFFIEYVGYSILKNRNKPLLRTNIFENLPRRTSHGSCTFMLLSMSPLLSTTVSSPNTEGN